MQHVNREAAEAMVAAWREAGAKEVLCDFEHNAEHGGVKKIHDAWCLVPGAGEAPSTLLTAFAQDTSPAPEAIRELLAEKDPEALKAKS